MFLRHLVSSNHYIMTFRGIRGRYLSSWLYFQSKVPFLEYQALVGTGYVPWIFSLIVLTCTRASTQSSL